MQLYLCYAMLLLLQVIYLFYSVVSCFGDSDLVQFDSCELTRSLSFTVKPNTATDDKVTPLVTAAAAGSTEIVELLLKVFIYVVGFYVSLKQ